MAAWLGKPSVEELGGIHINFLPLNYAYVVLNSTLKGLGVYSVSEDCYKCPYKLQKDKYNAYNADIQDVYEVYTGEQSKWRILKYGDGDYIQRENRRGLLCEMKPTLEEYGVYRLNVGKCVMETEVTPVNIYLPLLFFTIIMLSAVAAFGLIKLFLKRRNNGARYNDGLNLTAKRDNSDIMPSLHFLRGILLILIIFVTTGGGGYPIFSKSYGELTVANCLLFAYTLSIGLKIPIMFAEDSKKTMSTRSRLCIIFLRSLVLLIVGVAISQTAARSWFLSAPLWAPLPCIAISYFVVAVTYTLGTSEEEMKQKNRTVAARSLFCSWVFGAFLVTLIILSTHIFYSTECKEYKDFDPRRHSWMANGNNCEEKDVLSEVINKNLLGVNRDDVPFYVDYYYAYTKGLLGLMTAMLTALVGLKAGVIYLQHEDHSSRLKQWNLWATVCGIAGIAFAALSGPLSFNLWPLATIFLISSMTLFVYIFIYHLTEVHHISSNIITTCGVASIATLSGHLLFSPSFPFFWGRYSDTHFFYLWQSTWIVFLWVLITVCWVRYRTYLITKVVSDEGTRRVILAW